ncbi:MAG: DUF1997 domain-containing protein [Pseudanabaenaceae cyanobacterium]
MRIQLSAQETLRLPLAGTAAEAIAYLQTPRRWIEALRGPTRLTWQDDRRFRIALRPLLLWQLRIAPTVDFQITVTGDRGSLQSTGFTVAVDWLGMPLSTSYFDLAVAGEIRALGATLVGRVCLEVVVDLPNVLWAVPVSLWQNLGDRLLAEALRTLRERLQQNVGADFAAWRREGSNLLS